MKKKPTPVTSMAQLAKLAGCSVMTVSLALRNSPSISAGRRDEIQTLARQRGYHMNPLVSALMSTRRNRSIPGTETLALLTKFDEPISTWKKRRPHYSDLYEGMVERAGELGFNIEEFPTYSPGAPSGKRLTQILVARGICGVIFMPGGGIDRRFPEIDHRCFSMVGAAFHAREIPVHRVASDYGGGVELCLEELTRRGYRRIGLTLNRALDANVSHAFSGRFLSWQQQQPAGDRIPFVAGEDIVIPRGKFFTWFNKHRPDALLCTNTDYHQYLVEAGVRVPDEVACCYLPTRDNLEVSGFNAHTKAVGRSTINLMARERYLNHRGYPEIGEVVLVKGCWQEGYTVSSRQTA